MATCYNCDSNSRTIVTGKYFHSCSNCGAWIAELNQRIDFKSIYSENYFNGEEYLNYELGQMVHQKNFVRKLNLLEKYSDLSKMRILEIGTASGEFLKVARAKGISTLLGVEISDFARNEAIKKGFEVISPSDPDLNEIIKRFQPNIILAWDVWEHMETPSSTIKHYLTLASSDAILALTTVDSGSKTAQIRQQRWRQFHPPTHINYPTKNSFIKFCSKNNLSIIKHFHFGYYRPLAEYLATLFGKRKWIVESKLLFKIPMYLNLYDTQMIIAKKQSKIC